MIVRISASYMITLTKNVAAQVQNSLRLLYFLKRRLIKIFLYHREISNNAGLWAGGPVKVHCSGN